MSEFDPDASQLGETDDDAADPDVPELNDLDDNDPDDSAEYVEADSQDFADTVNPEQNKHEE